MAGLKVTRYVDRNPDKKAYRKRDIVTVGTSDGTMLTGVQHVNIEFSLDPAALILATVDFEVEEKDINEFKENEQA